MADRRIGVYVDDDVAEILAAVKPKSLSQYFNESVRSRHLWESRLDEINRQLAEIKALLSPNQ